MAYIKHSIIRSMGISAYGISSIALLGARAYQHIAYHINSIIRGMGISGMLFLLCQFTGISSLVVYMTSVFKVSHQFTKKGIKADRITTCNAYYS